LKDRLEAVQQEKTQLQAAITATQGDYERVKQEFIRENAARLLRVLSQVCLQQGITDAAIPIDGNQLREFKVLHNSKQNLAFDFAMHLEKNEATISSCFMVCYRISPFFPTAINFRFPTFKLEARKFFAVGIREIFHDHRPSLRCSLISNNESLSTHLL
jgi:hypothetical protein